MNDLKMDWLNAVKTASDEERQVVTLDEHSHTVILEWKKVGILSSDLADFKKDLSDLASEKLSESELAFLKRYPESASSELFLTSCKALLDKGVENADWHAIQGAIKASVKQFYCASLSQFGSDLIKPLLDDVYFCVTARRQDESKPAAFLLFSITPALPFGNVKVINFFVREESQDVSLGHTLMGLIFKILPKTKRIFLFCRPTDRAALERYAAMGFEKDENPFQDPSHKMNPQSLTTLEYRIEKSNILQRHNEAMGILE